MRNTTPRRGAAIAQKFRDLRLPRQQGQGERASPIGVPGVHETRVACQPVAYFRQRSGAYGIQEVPAGRTRPGIRGTGQDRHQSGARRGRDRGAGEIVLQLDR